MSDVLRSRHHVSQKAGGMKCPVSPFALSFKRIRAPLGSCGPGCRFRDFLLLRSRFLSCEVCLRFGMESANHGIALITQSAKPPLAYRAMGYGAKILRRSPCALAGISFFESGICLRLAGFCSVHEWELISVAPGRMFRGFGRSRRSGFEF